MGLGLLGPDSTWASSLVCLFVWIVCSFVVLGRGRGIRCFLGAAFFLACARDSYWALGPVRQLAILPQTSSEDSSFPPTAVSAQIGSGVVWSSFGARAPRGCFWGYPVCFWRIPIFSGCVGDAAIVGVESSSSWSVVSTE